MDLRRRRRSGTSPATRMTVDARARTRIYPGDKKLLLCQPNELGLDIQAGSGRASFRQFSQLPEMRFAWSGLPQNQALTGH